jgi:predicted RNase H-like nuclease (RuvC/YqgF family)
MQKQQSETKSPDSETNAAAANSSDASDAAHAAPHHVITNDEIPEHEEEVGTAPRTSHETAGPNPHDKLAQADRWKVKIREQKSKVASLQQRLASLTNSASGNCLRNCVAWNARNQQRQRQIDSLKAQLEQQQHQLEDMQESARKQGFGNSVYDP